MIALRPDQALIAEWIRPNARILDLGCGDGRLLSYLWQTRQVSGYGVEIDENNVAQCIADRVNVIQSDLDAGLSDFDNDSFDYVVMSQTLQALRNPARLIHEMLRVGREGIVTFPNMGYWRCRLQMGFLGRMPSFRAAPSRWYENPNAHLCTINDFESLCRKMDVTVLQRNTADHAHHSTLGMRLLPNFLGEVAIYHFCRRRPSSLKDTTIQKEQANDK